MEDKCPAFLLLLVNSWAQASKESVLLSKSSSRASYTTTIEAG
jgi:hypothetical protein